MGASAGFLIYSGIMPLLQTFITIFLGYLLAKRGLFPPAASRGASQVTMNLALPALIFANIIPSFNSQNIGALGPLILLGVVYSLIGLVFGYLIREVCFVPRNFWQGIIVACGISNWGNLPSSIVVAVTNQAPFDPSSDPELGLSYVSIFILVSNIGFWVCGAANSLAWDYLPHVPQDAEAYRRVPWNQKPIGSLIYKLISRKTHRRTSSEVNEKQPSQLGQSGHETVTATARTHDGECFPGHDVEAHAQVDDIEQDPDVQLARKATRLSVTTSLRSRRPSAGASSVVQPQGMSKQGVGMLTPPNASLEDLHSEDHHDHHHHLPQDSTPPRVVSPPSEAPRIPSVRGIKANPIVSRLLKVVHNMFNPATTSLYISIVIALVSPLKALFVDNTANGGPAYFGPDGKPPLNFIISTADLIGAITIPLSLVLLGASFARMQRPSNLGDLAFPAMISVTAMKLVILPVIGVALVQTMVSRGIIPREAKAERFVAMLLSGTPSAVNQVVVAQLYAKETGNMDTLCAFLLMQYIFMFFSSAAITAVSLALL